MAELNVITSMLDDLSIEQPIVTALCIGQKIDLNKDIQWQHFNVNTFLNQPFTQRYDLGFVTLDTQEICLISELEKTQVLVKLRDLMARRVVVVAPLSDSPLLRALGFTQLTNSAHPVASIALWQFNILTYKQVPDWLNAKFWANPENWNKFRW